ncbi:hypothetical protein [Haliangium sp.]|uniref:hypothetical protein n=1 Tax=Haliangium sp. TaxID=2663208 RepID=UPI003D1062E1
MKIERIRVDDLVERFPGTTLTWWRSTLRKLAAEGRVRRHGKFFFADIDELEKWLAGGAKLGKVERYAELRARLARVTVLVEGVAEETRDPDLVQALGELHLAREMLGEWIRE